SESLIALNYDRDAVERTQCALDTPRSGACGRTPVALTRLDRRGARLVGAPRVDRVSPGSREPRWAARLGSGFNPPGNSRSGSQVRGGFLSATRCGRLLVRRCELQPRCNRSANCGSEGQHREPRSRPAWLFADVAHFEIVEASQPI